MAKKQSAEQIRATRAALRSLSATRRTLFFFMRTLLLVLVIVGICGLAFVTTARLSNAYILVNEGMSLRAACILQDGEVPDLAAYLTTACLSEDAAQREQSAAPYAGMTISSYDYSLTVSKMHLYPWQFNAYVDVIEVIRSIKVTGSEAASAEIPTWMPAKYRLYLTQQDGRWLIARIELLELNPAVEPAHTADPYADSIPAATATPTASPTPSVTATPAP